MIPSSPTPRSRNPLAIAVACSAVVVGLGLAVVLVGLGVYFIFGRRASPAAGPVVEYILDASPRMSAPAENDSGTRLSIAQGVLAEIVRPASPLVTAGLRVFGSGALTQSCQDTALLVPLALANQGQISTRLQSLGAGANADAAMAQAMVSAIRDLEPTTGPHTLVVVTGGDDSCNPEAGQLISAEATRAGIALQLFVVGYQVPDDQGAAIQGLVDSAGSGAYINTHSKAELTKVLAAIQQYVDLPGSLNASDVLATAAAAAPAATATRTPGPPSTPTTQPPTPVTLSLNEAAQIVLDQIVIPASLDHEAIVFAWPQPLVPGDTLEPFPAAGAHASGVHAIPIQRAIPIASESWFFWVDDVPAGKFTHNSRFVLVDRLTGGVSVTQETWWPVLNGHGLWTTASEYWNSANWVYTNLDWRPTGGSRPGGAGQAAPASRFPQQAGSALALVINGWLTGQPGLEAFAADASNMSSALAQAGAQVTYLGPPEDANANRSGEATPDSIIAWLKKTAASLGPGDSAVIYISAHANVGGNGGGVLGPLAAADLDGMLGSFQPGVAVSVILDTSYSGAFIGGLQAGADLIITSTDDQTPAFFDIDPAGDPNPADSGSEFTSGLSAGLSPSAPGGPGPMTLRLRAAFGAAVKLDAAALSGRTHPQIWPLRAPPTATPPPTITPTSTKTPTPTPTATLPPSIYLVKIALFADQAEQSGSIKMPPALQLTVVEGTANFTGADPWVAVFGELGSDGSFKAVGSGTVAGIKDVAVLFEGTLTGGRLFGHYTLGTDGKLAQGQPVVYEVSGGRVESSGNLYHDSGGEGYNYQIHSQ